jgi:hypothetical protein
MHALSLPAIDAARRRDYWRARCNALDSIICAFIAAQSTLWDGNDYASVSRRYGADNARRSLYPAWGYAYSQYYRACRDLAALGVAQ